MTIWNYSCLGIGLVGLNLAACSHQVQSAAPETNVQSELETITKIAEETCAPSEVQSVSFDGFECASKP